MSEKQKLSEALKRNAPTEWGAAALSAIADQEVVFAGSTGGADNTAGELLRIYRLRASHCLKKGIQVQGLTELLASLGARSASAVIQVQPFRGPRSSVAAFWDATGNLVGVITIVGRDPEIGKRNLEFALGKS